MFFATQFCAIYTQHAQQLFQFVLYATVEYTSIISFDFIIAFVKLFSTYKCLFAEIGGQGFPRAYNSYSYTSQVNTTKPYTCPPRTTGDHATQTTTAAQKPIAVSEITSPINVSSGGCIQYRTGIGSKASSHAAHLQGKHFDF